MPIQHKKPFGIYHWDTFESPGSDTMLIDEAATLKAAVAKVKQRYGDRITASGADQVDIVNAEGTIVRKFRVI